MKRNTAGESAATTVFAVAQYWIVSVGKLNAQLMLATGQQL
jgi:hypothetical protein